MKTFVKGCIGVFLSTLWLWVMLSLAWTPEEVSTLERVSGFVYCVTMVPLYCMLKRLLKLD